MIIKEEGNILKIIFSAVILLLFSINSYATPLIQSDVSRIILNNTAYAKLYVYNPSNYGGFYKISLINSQMDAFGKISFMDDDMGKHHVKLTPKNFYLEANQKQLIRIKIHNIKNIDNEFRTNLVIKLQNNYDIKEEKTEQVFNFDKNSLEDFSNFDTSLLYILPIIYQKSATNVIKIENSNIASDNSKLTINFSLARDGNSSTYVNINIFLLDKITNEYVEVIQKNNKVIYYPNKKRYFSFDIKRGEFPLLSMTKVKIVITDQDNTIIDSVIH